MSTQRPMYALNVSEFFIVQHDPQHIQFLQIVKIPRTIYTICKNRLTRKSNRGRQRHTIYQWHPCHHSSPVPRFRMQQYPATTVTLMQDDRKTSSSKTFHDY